jgi:hypothetical protein
MDQATQEQTIKGRVVKLKEDERLYRDFIEKFPKSGTLQRIRFQSRET